MGAEVLSLSFGEQWKLMAIVGILTRRELRGRRFWL